MTAARNTPRRAARAEQARAFARRRLPFSRSHLPEVHLVARSAHGCPAPESGHLPMSQLPPRRIHGCAGHRTPQPLSQLPVEPAPRQPHARRPQRRLRRVDGGRSASACAATANGRCPPLQRAAPPSTSTASRATTTRSCSCAWRCGRWRSRRSRWSGSPGCDGSPNWAPERSKPPVCTGVSQYRPGIRRADGRGSSKPHFAPAGGVRAAGLRCGALGSLRCPYDALLSACTT